jgi:hypothetical protein
LFRQAEVKARKGVLREAGIYEAGKIQKIATSEVGKQRL